MNGIVDLFASLFTRFTARPRPTGVGLIRGPEYDTMPGSWGATADFMAQLAQYPTVAGWAHVCSELLAEGKRRGLDQHFRAGQSMQHMIFSTVSHHGLQDELRVTVAIPTDEADSAATGARLEVSLGRVNRWFAEPERLTIGPAADAWPLLAEYLRDLWRATRSAPVPDGLGPGKL